jgi:hypothetical protein
MSIFSEWTSSDSFPTRVNKLRQGLGVPQLDASTVLEDFARDHLFGEGDMNWLIRTGSDS